MTRVKKKKNLPVLILQFAYRTSRKELHATHEVHYDVSKILFEMDPFSFLFLDLPLTHTKKRYRIDRFFFRRSDERFFLGFGVFGYRIFVVVVVVVLFVVVCILERERERERWIEEYYYVERSRIE